MSNIVTQLDARRMSIGMSNNELSRRTGIARPNIVRFFRGSHDPRLTTVLKICEALGVELGVFNV